MIEQTAVVVVVVIPIVPPIVCCSTYTPHITMYPPSPPPPPPQWEYADSDVQPMPSPPVSSAASAPPLDQRLDGDVPRSDQFPAGNAGRGAAAFPVLSHPPAPWSTGLFDCFDDVGNCCVTCLCPCITFGQVAEILDRGSTSCEASGALYAMILCVTGCSWVYSCFYRSKLRRQFFLQEAPCADCLVHCCCESCALCQEYRELAGRGFHLRNGWKGANMERNHPTLTAPPTMTMEGTMSR